MKHIDMLYKYVLLYSICIFSYGFIFHTIFIFVILKTKKPGIIWFLTIAGIQKM